MTPEDNIKVRKALKAALPKVIKDLDAAIAEILGNIQGLNGHTIVLI